MATDLTVAISQVIGVILGGWGGSEEVRLGEGEEEEGEERVLNDLCILVAISSFVPADSSDSTHIPYVLKGYKLDFFSFQNNPKI